MESYSDIPSSDAARLSEANALIKPRRISFLSRFERLLPSFSPAERLLLYIFTAALAISVLFLLAGVNARASAIVPTAGGTLTEGVIGTARFINPLLALSEADHDLTALVYSGLTRAHTDGSRIPDLASSYTISEDNTTYTFTLRTDATFHDGMPVTSADVLYTIQAVLNPDIRSPRRVDWEGVTVSTPDPQTVVFTLPRPYAPFLENTTLGILPSHLWRDVPAEEFSFASLNTNPVGSGPYRIDNIASDKAGTATHYEFAPFKNFTLGTPHLKKITLLFFPNEIALVDAWNAGRIDSFAGVSFSELARVSRDIHIVQAPLPRIFGVFFNQNRSAVLADASVRAALEGALDKQALVDSVLGGYAAVLDDPIPPGIFPKKSATAPASDGVESLAPRGEQVKEILERGGWEFGEESQRWEKGGQELMFTLATSDAPELVATAEMLIGMWREAHVHVELHVYPLSELNTNIIRPREYDAILFGEIVGRTLDLFSFWHSSQRNDPGLNLALYTNARADTLLSEARATTNERERAALYASFVEILKSERPAIFLYAPQLLYVLPETIQGTEFGMLSSPAERFLNVHKWYIDTERVWSIFAK